MIWFLLRLLMAQFRDHRLPPRLETRVVLSPLAPRHLDPSAQEVHLSRPHHYSHHAIYNPDPNKNQ